MARQEALRSEETAAYDTVPLDGLHGVLRAGRRVTASRRQSGADGPLVETQRRKDQPLHALASRRTLCASETSVGNGVDTASGLTVTRISIPAGVVVASSRRNASRTRRRARLRTTAEPIVRGAVTAMRVIGSPDRRTRALNAARRSDRPSERTAAMSRERRRRAASITKALVRRW